MGKSDPHLRKFYNEHIAPIGETALLGFTNNSMFNGDLYDLSLGNWDINKDWKLPKKYDTIISLRCPYFAKRPNLFFNKCLASLKDGGRLYLDWGLGDHWRFPNYKIGWVKDKGEHEWAYSEDNFLWSCVWSDLMPFSSEVYKFTTWTARYGYSADLKRHIMEEVPSVFFIDEYRERYNIRLKHLALWPEAPQLYTLVCGEV